MIKIYNYSKNILIFTGFIYLFYECYKHYEYLSLKINNNLFYFIALFLVYLLFHNLLNFRTYAGYKIATNLKCNFFFWSKIFFQSILLNIFISHSGSVYRAIELKKNNVIYKDFISVLYILLGIYLGINLILLFIELIIFGNFNLVNQTIIISSILSIIAVVFFLPKIFFYLINFLNKLKIIFFDKLLDIISYINTFYELKIKILLKKLIFITLLIHFVELLIFYICCKIFFKTNFSVDIFFILFCLSFFVDRIPYLSQIPGVQELLFVYLASPFGLDLNDTFFIKIIMRFSAILSISSNFIFFNIFLILKDIKKF